MVGWSLARVAKARTGSFHQDVTEVYCTSSMTTLKKLLNNFLFAFGDDRQTYAPKNIGPQPALVLMTDEVSLLIRVVTTMIFLLADSVVVSVTENFVLATKGHLRWNR
jgi:hypothetical protein